MKINLNVKKLVAVVLICLSMVGVGALVYDVEGVHALSAGGIGRAVADAVFDFFLDILIGILQAIIWRTQE